MIEETLIKGLKDKFSEVHPLIFQRSVERAKTAGELFDILDTIPTEFPILWDESYKKWITTKDLFQTKKFSQK